MMKITIEYNDKIYNFEQGYETYIFCAAINNDFDKTHPNELKDFVVLVGECYFFSALPRLAKRVYGL